MPYVKRESHKIPTVSGDAFCQKNTNTHIHILFFSVEVDYLEIRSNVSILGRGGVLLID